MKIKTTEDGEHVMATGTYKPMIKVWELDQLAVKFERVTEAENVDFCVGPIFYEAADAAKSPTRRYEPAEDAVCRAMLSISGTVR